MHGERQREAILRALGEAPDGLDIDGIAAAVGIHPNTVRWHMAALSGDGRVLSEPQRTNRRGRPRIHYRAAPPRDDYRRLATMLADAVEDPGDAYTAGLRFGNALGREGNALEVLNREGFVATQIGDTIEMHRCPFLDLARTNTSIVCSLHRGLLDGCLQAGGGEGQVIELRPFAEDGVCRAKIA